MSSSSDYSNQDVQASQLYGSGALGLPAGTNAQRPKSPTSGMIRWNITGNRLEFYGQGAWRNMPNQNDLDTNYVKVAAPAISADLDANGHRLTDVANPTAPQDVVTLDYLEDRFTSGTGINADTLDGLDSTDFALQTDLILLQDQITTAIGGIDLSKYLRVDAVQTFTGPEKTQGRTNIGLGQYPENPIALPVSTATQVAINLAVSGGTFDGDLGGANLIGASNLIGMTAFFLAGGALPGWIVMRGQTLNKADHPILWTRFPKDPNNANLGLYGGTASATGTFILPDTRGYFPRAWNNSGSGIDINRVMGSTQLDKVQRHVHSGNTTSAGAHTHAGRTDEDGKHRHQVTGSGDHSPNDGRAGEIGNANDGSKFLTDANDDNSAHTHHFTTNEAGNHNHSYVTSDGTASADQTTNGSGSANVIGNETRPANIAMVHCIYTGVL